MSSVSPSSTAPLWDLAFLLEQLGDPSEDGEATRDLARQLARTFVASFPDNLRSLEEALATREAEPLRRVAHQIKGVCAIFAATPCVARAQRLETLAGAGDLAAALVEGEALLQVLRLLFVEIGDFAADPSRRGAERTS